MNLPPKQKQVYRHGNIDLRFQDLEGKQGETETAFRPKSAWLVAPTLMKWLREYDERIKVVWNVWKEKWEIWRESSGADFFVWTVENEDGTYRDLDARLMKDLFKWDLGKFTSPLAAAAAQEAEEEEAQQKALAGWRDDFDSNNRDHRRQLMSAYDAILNGGILHRGEPEKPKERRKPSETYIVDSTGRPVCQSSPSTAG